MAHTKPSIYLLVTSALGCLLQKCSSVAAAWNLDFCRVRLVVMFCLVDPFLRLDCGLMLDWTIMGWITGLKFELNLF